MKPEPEPKSMRRQRVQAELAQWQLLVLELLRQQRTLFDALGVMPKAAAMAPTWRMAAFGTKLLDDRLGAGGAVLEYMVRVLVEGNELELGARRIRNLRQLAAHIVDVQGPTPLQSARPAGKSGAYHGA